MGQQHENGLEVWCGIECTVNRVKDEFRNQNQMNGHATRIEDLERFAALGAKKIRYPVLWELVAPNSLTEFDWTWSDERLARLRELNLTPIVGLLHHGSGPKYTSLLDPEFPEKLASYARKVAERYPWVEWYTPVNEPLTTARFSALYGHWYPHRRDDRSFMRALINEVKGTILAMRAIREVNPNAKLVQTDDLGKTKSTPPLAYQVEFENQRRWLTFDLLFGRTEFADQLKTYLHEIAGWTDEDTEWFRANPCPPAIIGINHYPLSNRFLDHRLEMYPESFHGGNGIDRYVDVGAVDTGQTTPPAPLDILREVWQRYDSPFAVTEAHIAGPRESQMRWLLEIWQAAQQLRKEGAPIQAVTAWSLLGSFDWNSLCVNSANFYESGVFDVRAPRPRATALTSMLETMSKGEVPDHPVLERPGYWHEPTRILFAPPETMPPSPAALRSKGARPLVITGATGTLGRAFARMCEIRGIDHILLSRNDMDITSPESVRKALSGLDPWAVINTAGYVKVDEAEQEAERCRRENTLGPANLAETCSERKIPLVTFSSDLVFDGSHQRPYIEFDAVAPLNVYGHTKAEAERLVLERHDGAMVVRTSAFFGPWDEYNFAHIAMRSLRSGSKFHAASDATVSPTYVPDLVAVCLDLLIDGERGIIHLANEGQVTWADWAKWAARAVGADPTLVVECKMSDLGWQAQRPSYSALGSQRLGLMRPFEEALELFIQHSDRQL